MRVDTSNINIPVVLRRLGIEAKKQGREWIALCPNPEHDDKSPSWRIRDQNGSTRNGLHKCWPCGFGGTLIDLIMISLGGVSWHVATEWLAGENVAIERPVASAVDFKLRSCDTSFRLPTEVETIEWERWPSTVKKYLEERGIPRWQVDRWGIGFAVSGRLQGRIVFVKRDVTGKPIGYSARTFVNSKVRYYEPQPHEGANASAIYGEQHWETLGERERVYVVEGAINALAVERATNYGQVAATSGSQLHPMVAAKIASFRHVIAITDPDNAGDKLADTIKGAIARHGNKFTRVRLPEGQDAASIDSRELMKAIEHAENQIT